MYNLIKHSAGKNEYFTGWGREDLERYHRMKIPGEKPERISNGNSN